MSKEYKIRANFDEIVMYADTWEEVKATVEKIRGFYRHTLYVISSEYYWMVDTDMVEPTHKNKKFK